jgi:hypothetical protein
VRVPPCFHLFFQRKMVGAFGTSHFPFEKKDENTAAPARAQAMAGG